jgi:hypothetical protein
MDILDICNSNVGKRPNTMVQPFASNGDVDVEYGFPCMDEMGSIIILMISSKLDIVYDMDILNY